MSKLKESKDKVLNCPNILKLLKFKEAKELEAFCKEKDALELVSVISAILIQY